jgi:hypothetical protein
MKNSEKALMVVGTAFSPLRGTLSGSTEARMWIIPPKMSFCVWRFSAIFVAMILVWSSASLAATYDFLTVSGNGLGGNLASSTFTSTNGNGVINVTHTSPSLSAWGTLDNVNTAIYPSQFTTLFPGSGIVQGHLAMSMYNDQTTVIFDLTSYTGNLPALVFGIWNTTDEVALPAYNVQLLDASNSLVPPTTFNLIGNQDNQLQVAGRHMMQLITTNGDITAPTLINTNGVHTDAMFFDGIPVGTKQIIVTGHLGPLNTIGDGVGYYFAEVVPEPATIVLVGLSLVGFLTVIRRKRV